MRYRWHFACPPDSGKIASAQKRHFLSGFHRRGSRQASAFLFERYDCLVWIRLRLWKNSPTISRIAADPIAELSQKLVH
jgi:hypothetical protein